MTMQKAMIAAGLLFSTVLVALAVVPTASASEPSRVIKPAQDDVLITDQCAFPVLAHFDGPEIDTTFVDRDGNPFRLLGVFPGMTVTLTNTETGSSITLGATGSFHLTVEPDGSASLMVTGHGLVPPDFMAPLGLKPGIWYLTGRLAATGDADGNLTSVAITGTLVDLCPQLSQ